MLLNWMALAWVFAMFNLLVICPIIFDFFIIPKIERRLRENLKYKLTIYNWQVFARWFVPPIDIAPTIFCQYLIWKFKKQAPKNSNSSMLSALKQSSYDVSKASRFEIIMSFFVMFNIVIFIFDGIGIHFFVKSTG